MNVVFSLIASCFKTKHAWVNTFRRLIESSQFLLLWDGVIRRGADFNVIITIVKGKYASKDYVATVVLYAFLSLLLVEFHSAQQWLQMEDDISLRASSQFLFPSYKQLFFKKKNFILINYLNCAGS